MIYRAKIDIINEIDGKILKKGDRITVKNVTISNDLGVRGVRCGIEYYIPFIILKYCFEEVKDV